MPGTGKPRNTRSTRKRRLHPYSVCFVVYTDLHMPHMIGDVVPLVTGPMVDYLRGQNRV